MISLGPVAVVTGMISGVVVVDCDTLAAAAWFERNVCASPLVTRTRRGAHLWFRWTGPTRNAVRIAAQLGADGRPLIAPGVNYLAGPPECVYDVRADRGNATIPPSRVNGHSYTWERGRPGVELPPFLSWWRPEPPPPPPIPAEYSQDLGSPLMLRRAEAFVDAAAPAVAGQNGHNATFSVACWLWDAGLSPESVWRLLARYSERCEPPWSERDLRHKFDSARRAARRVIGDRSYNRVDNQRSHDKLRR